MTISDIQAKELLKRAKAIYERYERGVQSCRNQLEAAVEVGVLLEETYKVFSVNEDGCLELHEDYAEFDYESTLIRRIYKARYVLDDLFPSYTSLHSARKRFKRAEAEALSRGALLPGLEAGELDEEPGPAGRQLAAIAAGQAGRFQWVKECRPDVTKMIGNNAQMNCQAFVEYMQWKAWGEERVPDYYDYPERVIASKQHEVTRYELRRLPKHGQKMQPGDVLVFGADSRNHVVIYLGKGQVASLWTHNNERVFVGKLSKILEPDTDKFYDPDTVALLSKITGFRQTLKQLEESHH